MESAQPSTVSAAEIRIAQNLNQLQATIRNICLQAGRVPEDITLVAVSKTMPPELVAAAVRAGVTDIGENWVQEAAVKKPRVTTLLQNTTDYSHPSVRWHMIGHLQTNKVKKALDLFDFFHSVDSVRLAAEISRRAQRLIPVLIEVNTSGEPTKFGVAPDQLLTITAQVLNLPRLQLQGLMTIGPGLSVSEPELSRSCFRQLRQLKLSLEDRFGIGLPHLSMGMTADYAIAIEEGATILRIGTAIFGARPLILPPTPEIAGGP